MTFNLPSFGPGTRCRTTVASALTPEKWRSGLGAYFFADCTAVRNGGGQWGDYTVGAERSPENRENARSSCKIFRDGVQYPRIVQNSHQT